MQHHATSGLRCRDLIRRDRLSNHMLWKIVKDPWKGLSKWATGSHWSEARHNNGKMLAFGTPASIMAMLVIGVREVKDAGKKLHQLCQPMSNYSSKCSPNLAPSHFLDASTIN